MNSLIAEIFSVGKWNNLKFTLSDLKEIESNFKKLGAAYNVPLKLGHDDKQPLTDGLPALGWVESVWVEGDKLLGKFKDIPDVVFKAIKKKLYDAVSIELHFGVKHEGSELDNVLSGVALLGAELPAVKNLSNLSAYMSVGAMEFSESKHFTQTFKEHNKMPKSIEELEADLAAEKAKTAKAEAEKAKFSAENDTLVAAAKKREEDEAKSAIESKRNKINAMFEDAIKAKKILPVHRENFSQALRVDDDDAVMVIEEKVVESMINSVGGSNFSDDRSKSQGDKDESNASDQIVAKAHELQFKNPGMNFMDAVESVQLAHPQLAEDYIFENGIKGA